MTQDPVVEEVRARGRSLTARYGNDGSTLLAVLEERARRAGESSIRSRSSPAGAPERWSASPAVASA
jgi:hypothetical protein